MKVESLGDTAYLLRNLNRPAFEVAAAINSRRIPGLVEAVASYESVGVYVEPSRFDISALASVDFDAHDADKPKHHEIPVCYEMGPDLEEASAMLGIASDALVASHSSTLYRCYAVGFCPGFAYLGYLPPEIEGLPRKASPRIRVEPGSVAITGRQTAVYPLIRPGGWWLIGRTPLTLVDVEAGYFPIQAGDEVSFRGINPDEFVVRLGERL